jgi:hypothetical protein
MVDHIRAAELGKSDVRSSIERGKSDIKERLTLRQRNRNREGKGRGVVVLYQVYGSSRAPWSLDKRSQFLKVLSVCKTKQRLKFGFKYSWIQAHPGKLLGR